MPNIAGATVNSLGGFAPGRSWGCRQMIRMSLPWFLDVVSAIDAIPNTFFQGDPPRPSAYVLHNAKGQLEALFNQSIYAAYLRASREQAGKLYAAIDVMLKLVDDPNSTIGDYDVWSVSHERDQFKTIFLADLSLLPSFLVAGKESYEVNTLIDEGTKLFPVSLSAKGPRGNSRCQRSWESLGLRTRNRVWFPYLSCHRGGREALLGPRFQGGDPALP